MFAPMQQGGVIYSNKWDVITFAWAADPIGDYSALYGCQSFPPAGQNTRWCNETAQGAMEALFGHYDVSQRNADIKVLMQQLIEGCLDRVISRVDLFAYNKDLKNYRPNNLTSVRQYDGRRHLAAETNGFICG